MSLSLLDCRVGTVVDHVEEWRDDGKRIQRDEIRRGIVVKVKGDVESGQSCGGLVVQFSADGKPEDVRPCELVRVYDADSRIAREALRRIIGAPKVVGSVFSRKSSARRKIKDAMGLTNKPEGGIVKPEYDEDEIGGMDLPVGKG